MIPKFDEYKERFSVKSDDEIKPGLESIRRALQKVGNPEKDLRVIHVAGTNGKGSTIAFMESILQEHGFSTGVFSSPALVDVHDQIRMNSMPISPIEMDKTFVEMKEAGLSGMLTDFELLTVAAFLTFKRLAPDYVLLECGMGGKLDSTNVVEPLVSIITSIALDHVGFLGGTIEEIAMHKAGIIKEGKPVVVGSLPNEAMQVIRTKAITSNSKFVMYGEDFSVIQDEFIGGSIKIQLTKRRLKGPHQAINAAVAIEALRQAGVSMKSERITKGVATASLPYRFQEIAEGVFIDGAHNPAAAKMLTETIKSEFPGEKVDFVIGMLKTKDLKKTIDELIPVANSFTFITFPHPQAASAEVLMGSCQYNRKRMTKLGDDTIILRKGNDRKRIVAGSLYLLSSLLN
ncbi:bifunctional folylpolyglutamate synthase/dihydrofolate synthase [Sporosarcina sp. ACRSL]|uniref:bifunctional folylpolyglutamate synthase/dihydrofolate synthase n=1 Tax=Sporosarcina sp. ACRSL TaxID=2918215 RepID=UPI001EF65B8C|nr:folylpolyglutamate synthase/dihydrofolate synthase family protein [Sporosarcina sp. ACRSL]MCG7344995.1 bifunctional folylpolyglutamate synthase/dihydrofolate synthase [Sporosarcina sp. ACRSL]